MSLLTRIGQIAPSLPPSSRRIAQAILAHQSAAQLTISELATECGTSETSVVRFCQSIGISGYAELRLRLATDAGRESAFHEEGSTSWGDDISPNDPLEEVVAKISHTERRAIDETLRATDLDKLANAAEAIADARCVACFGIGGSYLAALDLAAKLRRIGHLAMASSDVHATMTDAMLFTKQDVLVCISHTGTTLEPLRLVDMAAGQGAITIAITNASGSPLSRRTDIALHTAVRESAFRSGAMASRISQLALVDAVFAAVVQRDHAAAARALEVTKAGADTLRQTRAPKEPPNR